MEGREAPGTTRPEPSIARNSAAQTLPVFVGYLGSFVSAPIVLGGLGLRAFGIWALTGALAQYGGLLDLGLGRAMSRFIALHDARGDVRAVGQVNAIGLLGTLFVGVPLAGLALVAAAPVASDIGHISTGHMRALLLCSAGMVELGMMTRALSAWPVGLRRMVAVNVAFAAGGLINFAFSVTTILLGGGLIPYALANLAASVVAVIVMLGTVLASEGRPPLRLPSAARWREVVVFAVKGQLVAVSDLINYQTDKIVIALTVGPEVAGAYDIANRVCAAARAVGVFTQSALVPSFAAWVARGGVATVRQSYETLAKRCAAISFPALLLCAASAPLLLSAWLGHVPEHGTAILVVLSCGYLANVSSGVSYAVAAAGNAMDLPARSSAVTALVNAILTAALAPLFGLWGVLAGTFLALSGGAAWQVALVQRRFGLALDVHWRAVRGPLILSAGLALPVAVVAALTSSGTPRAGQAIVLILLAAAYGASYGLLASVRNVLPTALSRRILAVWWQLRGRSVTAET